jgi:C_GCAxxG_C_C family probable redox protein
MLSVGEYKLNPLNKMAVKMTTGFAGGVADSRQELCGAFSAGIMVIGALYGRTTPKEDDQECFQLVDTYKERFNQVLGSIYCPKLRAEKYGSGGIEPCSVLVQKAAEVLLEVLE